MGNHILYTIGCSSKSIYTLLRWTAIAVFFRQVGLSKWQRQWHFQMVRSTLPIHARRSLSYRHRHQPMQCPTNTCTFCNTAIEDNYHMVVGCPVKQTFWRYVLTLMDLQHDLTTIWNWITFYDLPRNKTGLDQHRGNLTMLGKALTIIWQQHWRSVLGDDSWNDQLAASSFRLLLWKQGNGVVLE
ncbi:hypothetical protein [Absidia glauca]|uniref:Reverse transcriptase zinc-binding domain-containing protein n=1 Tax=Absidia glauca TaxID=4829 RepID=A0A163K3M5_ABSGL|nr:hypothetical protein [Absidia glauca]